MRGAAPRHAIRRTPFFNEAASVKEARANKKSRPKAAFSFDIDNWPKASFDIRSCA
jgi:hypothetical protein